MKINIFKNLLIFCGLVSLVSCGDSLADINIDPNTSPSARPQEVLTSGIGYYGIALDGYMNEDNAIFAQYWAGGPGVALIDIERYFIEPGDFSTEWSFANLQALSDLDFVIDNGNDTRAAVADIMSVCIYQTLVDMYGDVPYSEALRGSIDDGSILTPAYDNAKTIYDDLLVRLDNSIAKLSSGDELGSEDLVFQGDVSKWEKFANSLKLRILMRQSITDSSVGSDVVSLINNGSFIETADEIARIPFMGDAGNWNPQYARREQGIGMFFVASNSFLDVLTSLNDPRAGVLFEPAAATGTIVGLDQGNVEDVVDGDGNPVAVDKDDYSFPSSVAYSNDNDVILMSHWEVMFLRAEADMRFSTSDDETQMFNQAVSSHFDYIGAAGAADYLSTEVVYDASASDNIKSTMLVTQKWISMCGLQETEGWIESRRFDTPSNRVFTDPSSGYLNTPTRTAIGSNVFPSIRLYPQSELSFNPNTPSGRTLSDLVFWDN